MKNDMIILYPSVIKARIKVMKLLKGIPCAELQTHGGGCPEHKVNKRKNIHKRRYLK